MIKRLTETSSTDRRCAEEFLSIIQSYKKASSVTKKLFLLQLILHEIIILYEAETESLSAVYHAAKSANQLISVNLSANGAFSFIAYPILVTAERI